MPFRPMPAVVDSYGREYRPIDMRDLALLRNPCGVALIRASHKQPQRSHTASSISLSHSLSGTLAKATAMPRPPKRLHLWHIRKRGYKRASAHPILRLSISFSHNFLSQSCALSHQQSQNDSVQGAPILFGRVEREQS